MFSYHYQTLKTIQNNCLLEILFISTTNLAACVCVCAKFDQFLPARFYFVFKRSEHFVRIAKFPYAAFGPLFAFHCPLFVTKNNNLGWNRHASPHTGTDATFTGRRYCLRADPGLLMETPARPPLSMEMNTVALNLPALWPDNPRKWFLYCEGKFRIHKAAR